MMKIHIKPRVHVTLISMHEDGYRKNGGIGFSIEDPKGILTFSASSNFTFTDCRKRPLVEHEIEKLLEILRDARRALGLKNSLNIKIEGGMLTHFGMGSGTAIRLACLEALILLNDKEVTKDRLAELSERGGTSGIGVHTYFSGQFIFDLGIKNTGLPFIPSSEVESPTKPLLLDAIDFPNWKVGLCIPEDVAPKSQQDERKFFSRACPIDSKGSYKALYHSLFGVYSSVKEGDFEQFSYSIKNVQSCEWKRLEREEYNNELFKLEKRLYELGATCVGMSSLGPTLFFFASGKSFLRIEKGMRTESCTLIITSASNSGREITL